MQTQISCPNCNMPYTAEIHQLIDVGRNPRLKQMVLSGQLNLAVCPQCGAGGRIATPLLYHDPNHDLFMLHIPQEININQMQREEVVGRLVQQVVNQTPLDQRRGYMLQPQIMLTMQSLLEKVWETEGVTPEMLAREQRQAELLKTLAGASPDVQDYLLKERRSDIDETFFAILGSQIEAISQMGNNDDLLIKMLNLNAKLMAETEVGQKIEKRQVAMRSLNKDAKKEGGLTPELLLKHFLLNQEDEVTAKSIALSGQGAMNYEFFALLTNQIDKQEKAGNLSGSRRLTQLRDQLLDIQKELTEASQKVLEGAQSLLNSIIEADDQQAVIQENFERIDDAFMHVLETRMAAAEKSNQQELLNTLEQVHRLIVNQMQSDAPPEIEFLWQLVDSDSAETRKQLIESGGDMVSEELIQVVDMLRDQAENSGQSGLASRLVEIRGQLQAHLLAN